ncbi:thiamine-phosphate kinase [Candidatus Pelagibacter communis]|uniref:thiamine-phosphate kinase n=1 Tax=Pelagibacter ubique TaxID=198252 RepID=UPI00094DD0EF|nr:thiamine-phosphate kinase [Candidatus Pelagibacter ubique]
MQEFDLIRRYFSKLSFKNKGAFYLNDDVFFDKKRELVISIDTYNEGIHFLNFKNPKLVIKKIIRSSISDLICKGVKPKFYFISGSGNSNHFSKKNLSKISSSLSEEQKKYNIFLSGGDTTFSKKMSFSITVIGYSKNIILRNKAKNNDDIYVTGNLGDSYIGLQILKKKIKIKKKYHNYFIDKYYKPEIQIDLCDELLKFSNSSIDISDGLISDLEKLINKQKLNYRLYLDSIPISKNLRSLSKNIRIPKLEMVSKGDDYQILFTAGLNKARIIKKISKNLGIKITKIGKIIPNSKKSLITDKKGNNLRTKYKGYTHQF